MNTQKKRPKIGISVLVIHEGKILLGKRLNENGMGDWAPPGGHLEMNESIEECAKRELKEETNLEALSIHEGTWTNDIHSDQHYVTLTMIVNQFSGEVKNLEPHKCEEWKWFDYYDLPSPLYISMRNLIGKGHFFKLIAQHMISKEIAYLASPYASKDPIIKKNRLSKATQVTAELFDQGILVFSPLTHNVAIDQMTKGSGWDKWRTYDLSMLHQCGKMYLLKQPGWETSVGVQDEIKFAKQHNIPIEEIEC
ncbi:MAG: DUF1937 family protein [Rhabdochlamydiaceae bacterium]|nr:DUF1937 family protein [Candidatus Amphrikana amoebophyrae]